MKCTFYLSVPALHPISVSCEGHLARALREHGHHRRDHDGLALRLGKHRFGINHVWIKFVTRFSVRLFTVQSNHKAFQDVLLY